MNLPQHAKPCSNMHNHAQSCPIIDDKNKSLYHVYPGHTDNVCCFFLSKSLFHFPVEGLTRFRWARTIVSICTAALVPFPAIMACLLFHLLWYMCLELCDSSVDEGQLTVWNMHMTLARSVLSPEWNDMPQGGTSWGQNVTSACTLTLQFNN